MTTCDRTYGYVKCSEQKCCNVVVWYGVSALGSIPTRRSSGSPVRGLFCNTLWRVEVTTGSNMMFHFAVEIWIRS
jgi:hypothetical protein